MKNKSSKHKDANTFKFIPFAERISNIDIDIFHKVNHEYEDQAEEGESYFYQSIQKWNVLNLTEGYSRFKRDIKAQSLITLPQVLLEKDQIVKVLLNYLKEKDPLYLQPILDIVIAVAQDLQKQFYPHYQQFLKVIIDLLNTKDTDQLEWAFASLAHLFKILWRPMIKNINEVFISLLPLLSDSRPEYIRAFAAESFAFVARKVKDKDAFLSLLLKAVHKNEDGKSGCGTLLFQVINGIDGQFHNCSEQFLPFYFEFLYKDSHFQCTFFEIFEHIIANIVAHIHPKKTQPFWDALINNLSNLSTNDVANLELTLKLMGQMVEYKHGKLVQDSGPLIQQVVKLLSVEEIPESVLIILIQIGVSVLLSKAIRLPQEQASQLIRKILFLNDKKHILYFVDHISQCSLFETLILPSFLRKCVIYGLDKDCIYSLTKLLLAKRPLCTSGINLPQWNKYSIDFKDYRQEIFEKLSEILEDLEDSNSDLYFCALIISPHMELTTIQKDSFVQKQHKVLISLLEALRSSEDDFLTKKRLFWINNVLESLIHLEGRTALEELFPKVFDTLLKYASSVKHLCALKSLSFMFGFLSETVTKINILKNFNSACESNFSSPCHQMRLETSYIYSQFEHLPEFELKHSNNPEVPIQPFKVFSLIHQVETIEPLVHTYRDQLQRLEKLSFDKPQMIMSSQTVFKLIPLRYLCGVLYMNFKLLWEPVCKMIETHAHGMEANVFWGIFGEELKYVALRVKGTPDVMVDSIESGFEALNEAFKQSQKMEDKPDFINYRQLLWRALGMFADVAEAKTRDVSQLFLSFVEEEYTNANTEMATICNIKVFAEDGETTAQKIPESPEKNIEEQEDEAVIEDVKVGKTGRKAMINTFLNKLAVFSQFKSPKSMYREPELYRLYFDLLKHKNAEIQKLALDCLMTYKFTHLLPYKDQLYDLINDKNFKHVISDFRIDKETTQVQVGHREGLIPVILQIVFSKMSSKTGLRTGGKASGQNRRNLILRFLAGCEELEMLTFVQKSFSIYSRYLQDNECDLVTDVAGRVDLERCLAPKKLLSTVNLLNVILDQFGGLMGDQLLTYLLKILLIVGALVSGIMNQLAKVHSGYLSILRTIRTTSIKTLERFFEQFHQYPWNSTQIDAIFDTFIWPYLSKLTIEGIHSPTALLRLFRQWSLNPRFFKLLVKHQKDNEEHYILPLIFELLANPKSHISVVNVIYEMIECLLKYEASEEELKLEIEVNGVMELSGDLLARCKVNEKLNYGSCILLPHVPKVLEKIKQKLESRSKSLNKAELFILCRISELVWEARISDSVLGLLVPVVLKRSTADEEVVKELLTTVYNLLQNVENPSAHLRSLTPLFGDITHASCRKILLSILSHIAAKSESKELLRVSEIIGELNAFDAKWLDQPDFERRHQAFKNIQDLTQMDTSCGALLVFNLFYTMKTEKDLALRDNSSHALRTVCTTLLLTTTSKDLDYLLNSCIFFVIKTGLKTHNNQEFRNECISLLGHLARECPGVHFALRDLNKLTNKADLEVDFFENLTHLQMHRHARAMNKFGQVMNEETQGLNPKTVTQFLLPLATYYLCTEKFSGKNAVVDGAIDMVGVICRIVPWHQYEGVLKYTLSKLRYKAEFQKQLVRLVVVVLDGFHFDLRKGSVEGVLDAVKENTEELEEEPDLEDLCSEELDEEAEDGAECETVKIVDKVSVLCKSTATRVIKTIQGVLLPQLHRSLAEFTNYDFSHKLNRKKTGIEREEDDLMRVPISLAVVKLLQRLPKAILDFNLPRVFLKLCTFLKSHLESVRRVARETFQKIMQTLGPKYLGMLLGEIAPLMNRGFQVHVLVFTIHGVLCSLKGAYEPKDVDSILLTVLNLCTADLFGILSEEKEVVKIAVKISEARSTKSYSTLQILAQHITEKCLMDIILPIKKFLEASHSFKTVQKAQDALKHIALGLVDNTFISAQSLLKFAYGTSAQKIAELLPAKKKEEKTQQQQNPIKEDCFIIPKVPGNRTAYRELNVKTSSNTNAHIIIEFGLRLCFLMLKREKIKDEEYRPFIDPFVMVFKKCLKSKHVKLCSLTLQCLQWVMKYDIPAMQQNIKGITKDMFSILHKYAAAGLSKGDNFDLVVAAFKSMAVLVRDVQYYTVDTNQLKVLLLYVEQDMHDHDRQATAFSLLKAIIARKLIVPEIHDVMSKVAELSVVSELSHVRAQARSVFYQFAMEYPLGNTLEKHLSFFISQMSYEIQYGRESAVETLHSLINSFPLSVLKKNSPTLLVTLGARLVNDDVPELRKMIAECISSMLERLSKPDRDPLFEIITLWLKDKETSHRRLGAQLCGLLVTVEKEEFDSRLNTIVPIILKQFGLTSESAGKFVKINKNENTTEELQRLKDHHHFQVLQLILKICSNCPGFLKKNDAIENLAYHCQTLLAHPHDWVRLSAAQFLGFVLSFLDVDKLATLLAENQSEPGYLKLDPESCIKSLTLDLCDQLQPGVKSDLAEQVIKNLVFIARVLSKVPNCESKKVNLLWLCKRMRKVVNSEVIENSSSTVLRTEVFKWIAGVVTALDLEVYKPMLHHLLAPLVREMITTEEKNAPLRQLAKEVSHHVKKRIGMEEYTKTLQRLQQNLTVKRAERKRERTQLAVTDPEVYAKKKIKIHEKKKVAKKRKVEELRGKKIFKKRKVLDLEDNSEVT
ncbi:small subunit processome component 20 homolog [Euwallacea similis]|uniref:small subunit processome component 20 homolog n=1 Tax=Euwallacea similis TaxID=1736056 RepID=UPI00344E6637